METILEFLTSNKAVIATIVGILEGVIALINLWRQFRGKRGGEVDTMSASPPLSKAVLWAINPINLFRKPS